MYGAEVTRPTTGPMKFKDDLTGVFIRGDDAFHFVTALKNIRFGRGQVPDTQAVNHLIRILEASNEHSNGEKTQEHQDLRAFDDCLGV